MGSSLKEESVDVPIFLLLSDKWSCEVIQSCSLLASWGRSKSDAEEQVVQILKVQLPQSMVDTTILFTTTFHNIFEHYGRIITPQQQSLIQEHWK